MTQGRLPHLSALAARGGLHRIATAPSGDTAAAWASFATGMNAGRHGIFSAAARNPGSYRADLGVAERQPARLWLGALPVGGERAVSRRRGTSFWAAAAAGGIRASILGVPLTYPPEALPGGELLAGQPLPDLAGTAGAFSYFATDVDPGTPDQSVFPGHVQRLAFEGAVSRAELIGPLDPRVEWGPQHVRTMDEATAPSRAVAAAPRARLRVPFTVRWNREARTANVEIQGHTVHLAEQQWSRWIAVDFAAGPLLRLRGMTQMYLRHAGRELQLYVAPVHWHPAAPPAPISAPPSFARELYERLGPYRTLGWAEATSALAGGHLDEGAFLDDLHRAFDDRAQVILNRVEAQTWRLLVGVVETADRVQHVLWRLIDPQHPMHDPELARLYGGAIERVYRRIDEFVGEVLARLDAETVLLVLSDHGFHPFRHAVHLNTWLLHEGYLTPREGARVPRRTVGLDEIDWARTRAYSLGPGQIFINQAGREPAGIVPATQAGALAAEIAARLRALRDPQTGAPVIRSAHTPRDLYRGPFAGLAPDLQVGFEPGYRWSWETARGAAPPPPIVEPNRSAWSGDHAGVDATATAGVLVSSVPIVAGQPRLVDIAPTVLRFFGLAVPDDMDGRPLF